MTEPSKRLNRSISWLESAVILGCMAAALAIGTAQVVLRYVFNTGFHWSEAVFVLLTVTAMLFAASRAIKEDRHVRFDVVSMLLPRRGKLFMRFLADLAALALCGYFLYCGARYVLFLYQMGTLSPELEIPDWIIYLLVPITCSLFALRYVQSLGCTWRGEVPQVHGTDPMRLGDGT